MQFSSDRDSCLCPPMTQSPCPPPCPPSSPIENDRSKYYQEIGAEMIGNQLVIRLEKDKNKSKRKRQEWDPPCDCVEIQRPTSKRGAKIINADYEDRVVFRVQSSSLFDKQEESAYKSQTIAYKIESCRDGRDSRPCKTITMYPQKDIPESQEVYTNHITEGDQDVFLLRVKKKTETPDQKNRNVELEVRTPKPPTLPKPPPPPPTELTIAPPQLGAATDSDAKDTQKSKDSKKLKQPKKKAKKK